MYRGFDMGCALRLHISCLIWCDIVRLPLLYGPTRSLSVLYLVYLGLDNVALGSSERLMPITEWLRDVTEDYRGPCRVRHPLSQEASTCIHRIHFVSYPRGNNPAGTTHMGAYSRVECGSGPSVASNGHIVPSIHFRLGSELPTCRQSLIVLPITCVVYIKGG